ncbi:uncharacterized protein LOC110811211 isoform X2 [Carica papaya]|uniref:uncharacterized protein LOC110811211 isoform X2 n=1 Tax=Carica papaya TaxID=3649 RepID=UPI000B8CBBC1|nr:uncharacterized protein LOC110811211 isoform X2 [Carica papaya]
MEQEGEQLITKSEPESMVSVTVGRIMANLLSARPRKLEDSIARLSADSQKASIGSLDESVWFLHKYVREAAERKETLDEILVPIIKHTLTSKGLKHGGQTFTLFNWLFQDELLFEAVAVNLADIISRKDDRYIALGWCTLVRDLVEYESHTDQYLINGIREKYSSLLKILCSCISHLSLIIRNGSTFQDGFELPSRLSVSAADCFLAITGALTRKAEIPVNRSKSINSSRSDPAVALVPTNISKKKVSQAHEPSCINGKMELLLWNHLEELIVLVQSLLAWSRKSRPLHAKGLRQVLKWLHEINKHYGGSHDEAGSKILKTGAMLLSSCWKHYSVLLHLDDHKFSRQSKELLDQYLSGIQFYTENHAEENLENKTNGIETRKFFLNCLCLLLGRLDGKRFESTTSEYGMQLVRVLLSQLHSDDDDIVEGVVCIMRAAIFRPNDLSGGHPTNARQMDVVMPTLLHLLNERDSAARAVVSLIAEYCSINTDGHWLREVVGKLASGNAMQRRNAVDVISELIRMSTDSGSVLSQIAWQEVGNHLLECLGDEETAIRVQASNLLPMIDPSLVLPAIVNLVYAPDENVQLSASNALIGLLKYHNENAEVICMLLDSLSLSHGLGVLKTTGHSGKGAKLDEDRVLKLIPEWSKTVQNWNSLIERLIDKMFAEPSNAMIVRFLSCINEQLAESGDIVLYRVLCHVKEQKDVDESFLSRWDSGTYTSDDSKRMQQVLFDRLCPLLILRLLPMRVFDYLESSIMYGQLLSRGIGNASEDGAINIVDHECVAAILLNRAFSKVEFEDVRKLAAELSGRIHPQVLFPVVSSYLEQFAGYQDILKIKACLFSICTSLVVRGKDAILHPAMLKIRGTLEMILLWPSLDEDEVSKAQHGCIDCLALMICAELQVPGLLKGSTTEKINIVRKNDNCEEPASKHSVLAYVIHQILHDESELFSTSRTGSKHPTVRMPTPLPFRLCMANVLISVCQKIFDSSKKRFAKRTLPCLIQSVEGISLPEVRAACIQVLFSAVYHLKSAVNPYSSDLLKLCLKFLVEGSEKERMAGAKLMASLMASEDAMLESIAGGLLEARFVLSTICSSDPSPQIQEVCKKLLECIASS